MYVARRTRVVPRRNWCCVSGLWGVGVERGGKAGTYCHCDLEVEHPYTSEEAHDDADTCRKVLCNVVRISDDDACDETSGSLQDDSQPHNPIIPIKETMLANTSSIMINHAAKESSEERIEAQLNISNPHALLVGTLLEQLLEVHARQARHNRRDEDRRDADRVVHQRVRRGQVVGDALVRGGALVERGAGGDVGGVLAKFVVGSGEEVVGDVAEEKGVDGGVRRGEGDDADAEGEDDERDPTFGTKGTAEKENTEYGCDENLYKTLVNFLILGCFFECVRKFP